MKKGKLDVMRGSGNVFRDLGRANADVDQFKAILAAEIIKALDRQELSVRGAHDRTGIAAADFSRIRNADLGRFYCGSPDISPESAWVAGGNKDQSPCRAGRSPRDSLNIR
jgi:Helix-turn-helix domain